MGQRINNGGSRHRLLFSALGNTCNYNPADMSTVKLKYILVNIESKTDGPKNK